MGSMVKDLQVSSFSWKSRIGTLNEKFNFFQIKGGSHNVVINPTIFGYPSNGASLQEYWVAIAGGCDGFRIQDGVFQMQGKLLSTERSNPNSLIRGFNWEGTRIKHFGYPASDGLISILNASEGAVNVSSGNVISNLYINYSSANITTNPTISLTGGDNSGWKISGLDISDRKSVV